MNVFMVVDPNKCIGCRTCEVACAVAHSSQDAILTGNLENSFFPRLKVIKTAAVSVPVQCRHCEDAPCANVCPAKAIVNSKNSIQVNSSECIGCKNCILACSFGVMDLVPRVIDGERILQNRLKVVEDGQVSAKEYLEAVKCDLCINRPGGPACAEVCLNKAFILVKEQDVMAHKKEKRNKSANEMLHLSMK